MDFRVALTFLVLMITPATCRNIPQNESLSVTIDFIQKRIQTALHKLGTKQLLLNTPCSHIDVSEPERPFPTGNFGPIFCRTAKMSTKTPEVSDELLSITQSIVDATNGSAPDAGCSLPEFTDDMHKYKYVRCLLLRLDEWLCKAKI